jgi:hypothetical protein
MELSVFRRSFPWFAAIWLLLLFVGSIYSPPYSISDPGLGFLDLMNYSEGGKFQYHRTPSIENINQCIEERTTWWSPGQWFFVYLFTLLKMPLGNAISLTVLISGILGVLGWYTLYRKYAFSQVVILYSVLLVLISRYLFSAFQIYPGANILEFAFAPWMLLFWNQLKGRSVLLQGLLLFLLIIISYFIKSSLLIFWLGVVGSCVSVFQLKKIPYLRLLFFAIVFIAGKMSCDLLFTGGGLTPFNAKTDWIELGGNKMILLQRMLFILSGPFLSTIGLDDYIHYFLQKPGKPIFPDGHFVMLLIYATIFLLFILLIRYLLKQYNYLNDIYRDTVLAVVIGYMAFFMYAFISGKVINAYEESRHFRLSGLLLLPLAVQYLHKYFRKYFFIIPCLMFIYAGLSYFNKLKNEKILSPKYRVPLDEIRTLADLDIFHEYAKKSDFTYVIHSALKYDLDQCKTVYNQDDYTSLEVIRLRPKSVLANKTIVFLLPVRFSANGKREAILANYMPASRDIVPQIEIRKLDNWELIKVSYY